MFCLFTECWIANVKSFFCSSFTFYIAFNFDNSCFYKAHSSSTSAMCSLEPNLNGALQCEKSVFKHKNVSFILKNERNQHN